MQSNVAIKPFVGAFVVAGLIVAGLMPVAAPASAPAGATGAKLQRELDRSVNARVPGAVLVVRHGDQTLRLASGYAELKDRTRMRTSHRFRVGNVTTSFVATAVLQLVAEGKLALDDAVESRLPGAIPHRRVDLPPPAAEHAKRTLRLPQRQ
jgi:D-alanyl-D-alanine carboxypeptidase